MRTCLVAAILFGAVCTAAQAEPILQLYAEGATYDATTESWVTAGPNFTLWVIGYVGWKGTIEDVRLSVAWDGSETMGISFTPTTTGGLGGFTDLSIPGAPTFVKTVTDGTAPVLGDGSSLPPHGLFNQTGIYWNEYSLGDFTLTDSPIGDFIDSFPAPSAGKFGQINAYEVAITGTATSVQIDVYDHIVGTNNTWYKFAPFSHDAETGGTPVPEPGTLALLGMGALGLFFVGRRRRS